MIKRNLLKLIIFIAIVGIFSAPVKTHAQTPPQTPLVGKCTYFTDTGIEKVVQNISASQCSGYKDAVWQQNGSNTLQNANTAARPNENCGLTNPIGCISMGIGWIVLLIMRFLSLLTILAGVILNYVILYTVVQMSEHYSKIGAIETSWATIRDLANMTFIFILLYEAIKTIVGAGKETQKFVVNMIIAALLMNFSLFFTQLIIDASNLLTLTFYKAIVTNFSPTDYMSTGLSNSIMQPLNLQTIWKATSEVGISGTNMITIGIMGSIFTLIAAFVFFAIALLFIIRYVVLIFVLIFSPIFVVGSIIPGMKTYATKWSEALKGQVLFAPIYMILTWVVVKIFNSCGFIMGGTPGPNGTCIKASTTAAFSNIANSATVGNPETIALIINFIVVIAFLIATLIISKELSESSGKFVAPLTKWAAGFAGGATLGMAGRLGRGTIGALGQGVADSDFIKRNAPTSRLARLALNAGEKTGAASFDMRATGLNKQLGAGDAGGKGGYKADREKIIKDRMAQAGKMADVVTGSDVENEMANSRWNSDDERRQLLRAGLTTREIASINRLGLSKDRVRELGLSSEKTEAVRRMAQERLTKGSEQETARRQELFLHNMSQTRFRTPNLYSGISEDAEAARRLRPKQPKFKTKDDEARERRAKEMAEAIVAAGGGPTTAPTPTPIPPPTPPTP